MPALAAGPNVKVSCNVIPPVPENVIGHLSVEPEHLKVPAVVELIVMIPVLPQLTYSLNVTLPFVPLTVNAPVPAVVRFALELTTRLPQAAAALMVIVGLPEFPSNIATSEAVGTPLLVEPPLAVFQLVVELHNPLPPTQYLFAIVIHSYHL